MNRIKLAVIADDFTGGADAASFLKRKHANVVLLTGIPLMLPDCDCVVFALKIRSVPVSDAIKKVHDVLLFLEQYQVEHLYYKYCSTFDSTPKGNIGPVMDFLLDYYDLTYITSLIDAQKSPLLIYIDFDGICSGFLGSAKQIEIVKEFFKDFKTEKKSPAFYTAAKKIESILSFIAVYAKDHNYHKIIVAGGETSGAVTTGLGYSSFYIGQEICPGVPVLIPEENRYLQLILKSGNFGSEDFFLKAMEM